MRAALFSLVFIFACATAPKQELAASVASVNTAEQLGAGRVPEAAPCLENAKDEVAWARALIGNGRHERARLMTLRAESDAALAIAIVREREAQRAAEQAAGASAPGSTPGSAPNP